MDGWCSTDGFGRAIHFCRNHADEPQAARVRPRSQVSRNARCKRGPVDLAHLPVLLMIVGGHGSAFLRRGDLVVHQCSRHVVEIVLAKVLSCLHPRIGEEIVKVGFLWLIHIVGHAPITIVEKEALVSVLKTVCHQ